MLFSYQFHPQNIGINPTSIREYFERFGRVEIVSIPLRAQIGPYFIGFYSFESAFDALAMEDHAIDGINIHFSHNWYFSEMKNRIDVRNLLENIDIHLNDDCILMIMQHLNLVDFLYMAKFNHRFRQLIKERKTIRIQPSVITQPIGMMTMRLVLTVLGDSLTILYVSIESIRSEIFSGHSFFLKLAIIYCIHTYTGPQLNLVSLEGFESIENEEVVQFYLSKLRQRGVNVIVS